MVDQITFQIIFQFLQTVGILVGVFYYIMTLRNTQRNQQLALETRQAQLFMYMYDRWSDPEFMKHFYEIEEWEWASYDDFWEKYGARDLYIHLATIGRFLEGVGVLVKRGLVDPYLVDDLMSSHILRFWEKFGESYFKERRVRNNYPQFYEHVEYLYSVIKPIVESQHSELKA